MNALLAYTLLILPFTLLIPLRLLNPGPGARFTYRAFIYVLFSLGLSLSYSLGIIDGFSSLLGYTTILLGYIIGVYAYYYSRLSGYGEALDLVVDLFILLVAATFTAPSLLVFASTWTLAEITGSYLIKLGEEHSIEGSLTSSRGFLVTSTLTFEISAFTTIFIALMTLASLNIGQLLVPFTQASIVTGVNLHIIPLLLAGFITKVANTPMHFWLPGACSATPAPASAVLSGLMTALGFYGLYRVVNLVDLSQYHVVIAVALAVLGLLSVIYGWIQVAAQRDGRKLLAYATIATDGFISMIFALYLLEPSPVAGDLVKLSILMHAACKTTLFCEVGLIEEVYGSRYIHGVRGVARVLPVSSIGGLLAVLTLIGVPGTVGSIVKVLSVYYILTGAINPLKLFILLGFTLYIASSAYIALKYMPVYFNTPREVFTEAHTGAPGSIQATVLALGLSNIYIPLVAYFFTEGLREVLPLTTAESPLTLLTMILAYMTLMRAGGARH